MNFKFKTATAIMLTAFSAPVFANDDTSSIVGSWRMTSLQARGVDGVHVEVPYTGQVIFSKNGTLSVQAMNPDPNAESTAYTLNGYEAYYGPVRIDEKTKIFAITVESSLVRDLLGKRLERRFEVSGDQLVITPANPAEGWRVIYERL